VSDTLVVNASPLIFLGNANRLDLLRATGAARIIVPQAVFDEVTATQHSDRAAVALAEWDWIERAAPIDLPPTITEWDLGVGESAVIAVALLISGSRPVIDDLAGRRCALAVGLDVMGTLGIVIAAYRRGEVEDARKVLLDLRASGMWLSDGVIESALRLAAAKN
jgi:predicted nucleic acid-binding protein